MAGMVVAEQCFRGYERQWYSAYEVPLVRLAAWTVPLFSVRELFHVPRLWPWRAQGTPGPHQRSACVRR